MTTDLNAKQDLIVKPSGIAPIARLDFLDSAGNVREYEEYFCEEDFLKALSNELYYGVPLVVVLYRDEKGKTISRNFLENLDTLPQGLREEDLTKAQPAKNWRRGMQKEPFVDERFL